LRNASFASTGAEEDEPRVVRPGLLRDEVTRVLLHRVLRGLVPAGVRINEVRLAAELGVSRTPLREALVRLEHAGVVEARPGHGFVVVPLNPTDVREVYPIVADLEVLAMRSTPLAELRASVRELRALAAEMERRADDAALAQELDDRWHDRLLAACPNERLLALLHDLKLTVHRYEFAYMSSRELAEASAAQHRAVAEALAQGAIQEAAGILRENWMQSVGRILPLLEGGTAGRPAPPSPLPPHEIAGFRGDSGEGEGSGGGAANRG
jgi:DNA-binding GntR family transcriptional regulator